MFYFIGNTLGTQITGIESAQLKRLKLFAQFGERQNLSLQTGR